MTNTETGQARKLPTNESGQYLHPSLPILIFEGLSDREIAEKLHINRITVEGYVRHIVFKTGMRDRAELVQFARDHLKAMPTEK